jgi:hypothetical protein
MAAVELLMAAAVEVARVGLLVIILVVLMLRAKPLPSPPRRLWPPAPGRPGGWGGHRARN